MWTKELFGVEKPIIALVHLHALPGDPCYGGNMDDVIRQARTDVHALQDGGVDGLLIANEFSMPYQVKADYVTVASIAYIVGQIKKDIQIPYGVNVVLNPLASLDLAAATGAQFIRSSFTGAYMGEYGISITDAADIVRRKKALRLDELKMLYKVNPESDAYLVERDIKMVAKSIVFGYMPDALCVSGENAGSETKTDLISEVKSVAGSLPVFCNTGFNAKTAREKLAVSDGACVGTAFKKDGKFENDVDPARVVELMDIVRDCRRTLLA
jgi:membrane complex biogenesis BtpA family protein